MGHWLLQQPLETGSLATPILQMRTLRLNEVKSMTQSQMARNSVYLLPGCLLSVCPRCSLLTLPIFIQSCIFLISGLKIRFHFISTILHSLSLPPPSMPGTQSMDQSALGKWMMPRPRWVWLDCVLLYIGSLAAFHVECEPLPYLSSVQRLSLRPAFVCWDRLAPDQQHLVSDLYLHGRVPQSRWDGEPGAKQAFCQGRIMAGGEGRLWDLWGAPSFPEPPFTHLQTGAKDSYSDSFLDLLTRLNWDVLFSVHFGNFKVLDSHLIKEEAKHKSTRWTGFLMGGVQSHPWGNGPRCLLFCHP